MFNSINLSLVHRGWKQSNSRIRKASVWNLKFSQLWLWRQLSSGLWQHVVWLQFAAILEGLFLSSVSVCYQDTYFCDLKMGAVCSSETSADFDAASQEIPIFTAVLVTLIFHFNPCWVSDCLRAFLDLPELIQSNTGKILLITSWSHHFRSLCIQFSLIITIFNVVCCDILT